MSPKDQPCSRCGRPSYKAINRYGTNKYPTKEWRCFPHAVPDRALAPGLRNKLRAEELERLRHIDRGFPGPTGDRVIDERVNAAREAAYGAHQRSANPNVRIGLDR